ncbi:aromatic prenyltransferase [Xylariaceae sp. AK1471]|nr:aromatic prenyltransferase [Xylariaceae sp. AK1471]
MLLTEPANNHEEFWRRTCGVALGTFLSHAWYSPMAQAKILHVFISHVIPYMGREHGYNSKTKVWQSFMTDDHNPIELSWDWGTGENLPIIRFSIEPVGLDAGTFADPKNTYAAANFRDGVLKALPDTNLVWFEHFEGFFNRYGAQGAVEGHCSKVFWAFDLREDGITNKAYFFPGYRARLTSQTNLQVISQGIEEAPSCQQGKVAALEIFREYVTTTPDAALELDMLAIDLIDPRKSRLKIYFRGRQTAWEDVYHVMTLGGKLKGDGLEGSLQQLRQLWDLLFDTAPLPPSNHRTAGILYNVEFRIDSKEPKVKIYIPVRHYVVSDRHVMIALRDWMSINSGGGFSNYERAMYSIFREDAICDEAGLQTYVGCSIELGGKLRVVSYVNPQADKMR